MRRLTGTRQPPMHAYVFTEVSGINPVTPSSPMAETESRYGSSVATAVGLFAAGGKTLAKKKEPGQIFMEYGAVYVDSISLEGSQMHSIKTLRRAESYRGTPVTGAMIY